jgi:hypothetical protein
LARLERRFVPPELFVNEVRLFLQVWFEDSAGVGRIRVSNNHHIIFGVIDYGRTVATTDSESQSSGVFNGPFHLSVDQVGELISRHPGKISYVVGSGVSVGDFLGGPY